MAELFGPFKGIPKGAGVFSPAPSFLSGSSMIPIPNFSGGAAGPSLGESMNTGGNIGPVQFQPVNFKSSSWLQYAVIGVVIIVGVAIWRRK